MGKGKKYQSNVRSRIAAKFRAKVVNAELQTPVGDAVDSQVTHQTRQPKPPPGLGTIIVDTCFLSSLAEAIDKEYRIEGDDTKEKYWIDALFVLAKNGFSVKIPEMVAFEAAGMFADGKSIYELYPDLDGKDPKVKAKKPYDRFLKKVLEHKDVEDIAIVKTVGESKPAKFLKNLFLHYQDLTANRSAAHKKNKERPINPSVITESLNDNPRDDFGDIAAKELVANTKDFPQGSKPIFYFTDDNDAFVKMKEARPDIDICQVTAAGFLYALKNNDLLSIIDAKIDCGSDDSSKQDTIRTLVTALNNQHNNRYKQGAGLDKVFTFPFFEHA